MYSQDTGIPSLVGKKYSNGMRVSNEMAETILKVEAPEKDTSYISHYTIDTVHGKTQLIAMLRDGTVEFVIPMREELSTAVALDNVDDYMELTKDTSIEYKHIRNQSMLFLGIMVVLALGLLFYLK